MCVCVCVCVCVCERERVCVLGWGGGGGRYRGREEDGVLINDALNTFYLRLYFFVRKFKKALRSDPIRRCSQFVSEII